MEKMYIRTDIGIADILQRYKTFANGKYSRLSHVYVWNFIDAGGVENAHDMFTRFGANLITPATTFFSVYNAGLDGVSRILAETRYLENIQILKFSGYNGTLRDLITLVKRLPSMTTLKCVPGNIDFGSDSTQFTTFIDDIYEESYPLSHCFRRWEIAEVHRREIKFPAETALAFAILCTNFTLAYVPLSYKSEFDRKIKDFIASGQNDKYVDKIRRLFIIID
ncbi:hypothetical protein IWW48_005789 [Coemansia sp. RSA 1200]|nr:hypothetical protein IWW48_005789 [Coemansia sp. RSA 1200]